jgi:hypothetical protein
VIDGFIDRNPIYPTEKLELWVVLIQSFEHLQKHHLAYICRVCGTSQHTIGSVVYRPFVLLDQLAQGVPVALSASFDELMVPVAIHHYRSV